MVQTKINKFSSGRAQEGNNTVKVICVQFQIQLDMNFRYVGSTPTKNTKT